MDQKTRMRILERVRQIEETARAYEAADMRDPRLQEQLARSYQELSELQELAEVARRLEGLEREVTQLASQVDVLARRREAPPGS
ncbi:MAG: hypothetical protein HY331_04785 [Chloroflexi bacterium]|nr:hypothetical protein [Chloroflexota bacterium]